MEPVAVRSLRARQRALSRIALVALAASTMLVLAAAPARAEEQFGDLSGGAFQILAPGEEGSLFSNQFSIDQGVLYNALTPLQENVTTSALETDFVSEKFGVQGPVLREEVTPRAGLQIIRDSNDIPHIYGSTRADVMFGSGWVAAEDRGLLLRLGLGPAFVAALDVPGLNPVRACCSKRAASPRAPKRSASSPDRRKLLEEAGPRAYR